MKRVKGIINCIICVSLSAFVMAGCSSSEGITLYDSDQYQTVSINEGVVPEAEETSVIEAEETEEPLEEEQVRETDIEKLFSLGAGVFSWDHLPNIKDVQCMQDNHISEIYQYLRPEYTDREMTDFLQAMNDVDIDVYILDGEPEWSYEAEYPGMRRVLERVRNLNSSVEPDARIKGIVYDVEPYVLDKWHNIPDQLLEEYTNNIISIKQECEADEDYLDICICIPYSYDNMGHDRAMRKLLKESDQVFVLNYLKGMEIENIKREAALARYYSKRIVNVYELQPGLLSQTNNTITYYKDGIEAVTENYAELMKAYPDHNIAIAYHTLEYLRVLSLKE
ncbi:MAG: hypothetical protein J6O03_10735 [Butyrivibrio sp.]|nr:hypothetical protein [Butyrivibrio sp.]